MKDYLAGIATILAIIFLLGKVTLDQVSKVNLAKSELDVAMLSLSDSTRDTQSKNRQLQLRLGNDDVARFMQQNGATLQGMLELNSINQRLASESEALRIPIQEQKTDERKMASRTNAAMGTVSMHEYSISILSSFRDSLVWLGKIEESFPFARVISVTYTPSGDYVSVQTKILFPRMDPNVISR